MSTPQRFIETFSQASISEHNLLCELYLHNEAILEDRKLNLIPLVGEIQIRAFVSFPANHLTWKNAFVSATHNEENCLLWIRAEPQNVAALVAEHRRVLQEPVMTEHIRELQAAALKDCQHYVKTKGTLAIQANNLSWEHCPNERREYHPFNPPNLQTAISRLPNYVKCMQKCAQNWLGYHFHFPLLWLPAQQYKAHFTLSKKEELAAW